MAIERNLLEVDLGDPASVDEVVAALAHLGDGAWCNLEPFVDQADLDDLRARSPHPLLRMFMKAGAPIPLATVMRDGASVSIGLEHSHAARAIPYLREHEAAPPREWKVKQDHVRRGIVLAAPPDVAPRAVLDWIVGAARLLGGVPVGNRWTALVCTPTR